MNENQGVNFLALEAYQKKLQTAGLGTPDFHVTLGSGYGQALDSLDKSLAGWSLVTEISFSELPGFAKSTVQDHAGKYRIFRHESGRLAQFQMGRLHGYEGHSASQVVQTVMVPRLAGTKNFILTNAAGGLNLNMSPGDAMVISDHVNFTGLNPLIGENPKGPKGEVIGPRFPDMVGAYNKELRSTLQKNLSEQGIQAHEGIYIGVLGPNFETSAEIQLFSKWGMGAVGMSTVWEAIALQHSGARLAAVSLISNLGAGLVEQKLDHSIILETCRRSALQIVVAIFKTIEKTLQLEKP